MHKPAVLGASMGGMIAQQLAVVYPNSVGSLILINTAVPGNQSIHPSPRVEKQMLTFTTNKICQFLLALELFFPPSQRNEMACALLFNRFEPHIYNEIKPAKVITHQQMFLLNWSKDNKMAQQLKKLVFLP